MLNRETTRAVLFCLISLMCLLLPTTLRRLLQFLSIPVLHLHPLQLVPCIVCHYKVLRYLCRIFPITAELWTTILPAAQS